MSDWVLLAYRLPREPSTPRIALWRRLRRLGVAQVLDGLAALPADSRTREQFEWLAAGIVDAGGEASVWLGRPGSRAVERAIAEGMRARVAFEYSLLVQRARASASAPLGARQRRLGALRRELRRIMRRDFFPPTERDQAIAAVEELAATIAERAA